MAPSVLFRLACRLASFNLAGSISVANRAQAAAPASWSLSPKCSACRVSEGGTLERKSGIYMNKIGPGVQHREGITQLNYASATKIAKPRGRRHSIRTDFSRPRSKALPLSPPFSSRKAESVGRHVAVLVPIAPSNMPSSANAAIALYWLEPRSGASFTRTDTSRPNLRRSACRCCLRADRNGNG